MDTDANVIILTPIFALLFAPRATTIHAVLNSLWRAIIPSRDYTILFYKNRPNFAAQAISSFSHPHGYAHIVLVEFHAVSFWGNTPQSNQDLAR
jgi:hypothetical protein